MPWVRFRWTPIARSGYRRERATAWSNAQKLATIVVLVTMPRACTSTMPSLMPSVRPSSSAFTISDRRMLCPIRKRWKQPRQPLDTLGGQPLVHGQDEDTISQPAGVGKTLGVDGRRKLLPVGSHIHAVSQQAVSPAVAVLGYQRQPEWADTVW